MPTFLRFHSVYYKILSFHMNVYIMRTHLRSLTDLVIVHVVHFTEGQKFLHLIWEYTMNAKKKKICWDFRDELPIGSFVFKNIVIPFEYANA